MRRVYDPAMPVVTISASYGSGGSEVAPALAERLGVRFVDRSISPAGGLTAGSIHAERELHDRFSDRDALEAALRDAVAAGDVVILGRAGALALRDHPSALHVRLDGPSEARVFRAMEVQSVDEATARERLGETDRARERFVRDIYGLDPTDPGLYAIVLDGTAFTTAACVEVIVTAVAAPRRHIARVVESAI